jgi:branched-chain amino acid transport system ATP-binding protein
MAARRSARAEAGVSMGACRRRHPVGAAPIDTRSQGRVDGRAPVSDVLLQVSGLGKRFGGFVALADIELEVQSGERLGLIGPNGSGKSTLVNCLCGTLRNEMGSVKFAGQPLDGLPAHVRTRLGLARSFQLPRPFGTLSLAENLRIPILYTVQVRGGVPITRIDERCDELLDMVGLASKAQRLPRDLTQIEMRKLGLARAMASEPRLLIADEAMAGLSHQEVDDILALLLQLNEQGVTIIMIEHIMRAVLAFSQRLVVLVAGRKIADGDPQAVVRQDDVVQAYLGS